MFLLKVGTIRFFPFLLALSCPRYCSLVPPSLVDDVIYHIMIGSLTVPLKYLAPHDTLEVLEATKVIALFMTFPIVLNLLVPYNILYY